MKTKTLTTTNLMNRSCRHRGTAAFLFIPFVLACFALSPQVQAVCEEGCNLTNENTFLGDNALSLNTTGFDNTAIGFHALASNSTGAANTATGELALASNTAGFNNTADGGSALATNSTGGGNTATGQLALASNTTGSNNTATGFNALVGNNGDNNTASGSDALENNTTGSNNIALGNGAGFNLTTGNNNIEIGNAGVTGESRSIRIGTRQAHRATFIAGISGATVPTGVAVIVDANGHLGTTTSSARFKDAIQPMDKTSEAILALKPVTFRYKKELDPDSVPQFGLVAEEVARVDPDLVAQGEDGKPYTVRYEAVNAMLLNEFLKEHKEFVEAKHKIDKLETTVASLVTTVKEQAAQIQKVNARLELSKSAPQTVLNSH